jgi:sigma-B regulation protein RsbU (phosphoserine phosphatase)
LKRELRITEWLQRPLRANLLENAFPGVAITAVYEPAWREAEVGGDFFDAFWVGNTAESRRVVLCMGDVLGKGLKAAGLAARLKEVLHAFMGEDSDPAHTLLRLNHYLCDTVQGNSLSVYGGVSDFPSLCALSLVVFDPETAGITVATAGAEPVSVLRAAGYTEEIAAGGLTLGVQHGEPYRNTRITLLPGDTLLMTTDGLTEARKGKEFLSYEGLIDIAQKYVSTSSVSEMGRAILRDARTFSGTFNDDVCLLLARCQ